MRRTLAWAGGIALLSQMVAAQAATYYVDPTTGNDANSGTSTWQALRTLARANVKAVAYDTVLLAPGKTFDEALVVKGNVTYDTVNGSTNRAILRGSRAVGTGSGLTWSRLSATSNIWVASTNAAVETGEISQLLINGVPMTRARTPNIGKGDFAGGTVLSSNYAKVTANGDPYTLNVDNRSVPAGADVKGATAYVRNVASDLGEFTVADWQTGSVNGLSVKPLSYVVEGGWYFNNRYVINAGSGYWLENKLWMLDSPGEWFFDAVAHKLYVWTPTGASPATLNVRVASQRHGVIATNVTGFTLKNLLVTETMSDGISMINTSGAKLQNVAVYRAGRRCLSMSASNNNTVTGSAFERCGKEGVWLGYFSAAANPNLQVPPEIALSTNISITNSSIKTTGLRGRAEAGARLGEGGVFSNNKVDGSTYLGVMAFRGTRIEKNTILNSCTGFDDCGGIYVAQPPADPAKLAAATGTEAATSVLLPNNLVIADNIVDGGTGSADGVPLSVVRDTRGIYLDDYANAVTVSRNLVTGMTYGYMLHTAFNNTVSENLAVGNRSQNLLMQQQAVPTVFKKWRETDPPTCPAGVPSTDPRCASIEGEMRGNTVSGNAFVARKAMTSALPDGTLKTETLVIPNIQQQGATVRQFAKYDLNRYATLNVNSPAQLAYNYGGDIPAAEQNPTFPDWQRIGNDVNGSFRPYKADSEAHGLYNADAVTSAAVACPTTVTTNCSKFINLKTGLPVTFPLTLAPKTSIIVIR